MRFQVVDLRRRDAGAVERGLDHLLLGRTVRHRQAGARPVLVDRRAADHGPDPVAVRLRFGEPLEHHHPAALAPDMTVGGGIERPALAGQRQHPDLDHEVRHRPRQDRLDAAGQGEIDLAALQGHRRFVDRGQRGGAGHVQRHRRPHQAEREGDAPDGDTAGGTQIVDAGSARARQIPILAAAEPGIHAGAAASQPVRIDPGVLEGLPGRLQQHPLLRIHRVRFDRPDPEEPGVELVDPLDKAAATMGDIAGRGIAADPVPGPGIRPSVGHRSAARLELPPVGREVRSTGEPAGHADDRNPVVVVLPHRCGNGRRGRTPRRRRGAGIAQLPAKVTCQGGDVRIVEHQRVGCRVGAGERAVQSIPQLHRHQRVHAQVEEADRRRRRRGQPQHGLHLALQVCNQDALALFQRRIPQARQQILRRSGIVALVGRVGQQRVEQRRTVFEGLAEHRPVDRRHHAGRQVMTHEPVEHLEALVRCDPADAAGREVAGDPFPLLLRLADARPGAPGDRLARQPSGAAVRRELIQESVRCRVVGLARIAHHAGNAREEDEQVEIPIQRRPVQVPGPEHLRPQHCLEALPALVAEGRVGQYADAVDHPAERRQLPVHALEHRVDRGRVRHIREFDLNRDPAVPQRLDRRLGFGVRRPPAVQHDRAGAAVRQPARYRAADAAEAAGHENRAVLPQPAPGKGRVREHDLADMPGRTHRFHGGAGLE